MRKLDVVRFINIIKQLSPLIIWTVYSSSALNALKTCREPSPFPSKNLMGILRRSFPVLSRLQDEEATAMLDLSGNILRYVLFLYFAECQFLLRCPSLWLSFF